MCDGTQPQLQDVINTGMVFTCIDMLEVDFEMEVQTAAMHVALNAAIKGSPEQIETLVEHRIIASLCHALEIFADDEDEQLLACALIGLRRILEKADSPENLACYCSKITGCLGLDDIRLMAVHYHCDVHHNARILLHDFFGEHEGAGCELAETKTSKNRNMVLSEFAKHEECNCQGSCILRHIGGHSKRLCRKGKMKKLREKNN
jgi:hypothetical protein